MADWLRGAGRLRLWLRHGLGLGLQLWFWFRISIRGCCYGWWRRSGAVICTALGRFRPRWRAWVSVRGHFCVASQPRAEQAVAGRSDHLNPLRVSQQTKRAPLFNLTQNKQDGLPGTPNVDPDGPQQFPPGTANRLDLPWMANLWPSTSQREGLATAAIGSFAGAHRTPGQIPSKLRPYCI